MYIGSGIFCFDYVENVRMITFWFFAFSIPLLFLINFFKSFELRLTHSVGNIFLSFFFFVVIMIIFGFGCYKVTVIIPLLPYSHAHSSTTQLPLLYNITALNKYHLLLFWQINVPRKWLWMINIMLNILVLGDDGKYVEFITHHHQ